jgi:hypothetical protein
MSILLCEMSKTMIIILSHWTLRPWFDVKASVNYRKETWREICVCYYYLLRREDSITVTNTKGHNRGTEERSSGRVVRKQTSHWQSRIIVIYESTDNFIWGTSTVISRCVTMETRMRSGNERITLTAQETPGRILESKWNFLPERKPKIYINKFSLKWFLCL